MSSLGELDRSKVVDLDLGSNEFKQNARNILAEWAKPTALLCISFRPSAGRLRSVCGCARSFLRHRAVLIGAAEGPRIRAVRQIHGRLDDLMLEVVTTWPNRP
jgi:hypothetical protein